MFLQQNRLGTAKQFSKINLVLVIDNSGSFRRNDPVANQLLYALRTIEKRNSSFRFELITSNYTQKLQNKDKFIFESYAGNDITPELPKAVKQATKPGYANFNLVLFDGDMLSDSTNRYESMENFACLNTSNTYIISDPDNEKYLKRYAKRATVTITKDYISELETLIFKMLQLIR